MSGNLTVTYNRDSNSTSSTTDNLNNILTGYSGSMAIVGELSSEYGGLAGKKFSAVFTVLNGTISAVTQYGNSDLSNEELEKAAVGTLAGYLAGAAVAIVLAGAAAPIVIIGAGITAVGTGIYSDDIYTNYVNLQTKVFNYLISNEIHPVQTSSQITSIEYYQDGFGTIKRFTDNMDVTATMTYEQLLDSTIFDKINDNNSSWNIVEANTSEQLAYNKNTLEAIVNTSIPITSQSTPKALEYIFTETQAKKLTLNNQTYNISNLNALELRNAIDGIDSVSFLLSNILIKIGEQIDLGSKGIYTVKSKDTLSTIAQQNGYVTKDLVKLNPWLFDDGRIKFNYPDKVLIKEGTIISDNNNHILDGTNANDFLKDANGGNDILNGYGGNDELYAGSGNDTLNGGTGNDTLDGGSGEDTLHGGSDTDTLLGGNDTDYLYGDAGTDTLFGGDDNAADILVGGSGQDVLLGQDGDDLLVGGNSLDDMYSEKEYDYLDGGSGYDTYYVSNQDYISDTDFSGSIVFNEKSLDGTKTKVAGSDALYEDDNFLYAMNGSNMVVIQKSTNEFITIENFNFESDGLGINFDESVKKDIELYAGDASVVEGGDITFDVGMNAGEGEIIDNDDIFMRVA